LGRLLVVDGRKSSAVSKGMKKEPMHSLILIIIIIIHVGSICQQFFETRKIPIHLIISLWAQWQRDHFTVQLPSPMQFVLLRVKLAGWKKQLLKADTTTNTLDLLLSLSSSRLNNSYYTLYTTKESADDKFFRVFIQSFESTGKRTHPQLTNWSHHDIILVVVVILSPSQHRYMWQIREKGSQIWQCQRLIPSFHSVHVDIFPLNPIYIVRSQLILSQRHLLLKEAVFLLFFPSYVFLSQGNSSWFCPHTHKERYTISFCPINLSLSCKVSKGSNLSFLPIPIQQKGPYYCVAVVEPMMNRIPRPKDLPVTKFNF
jgi:hypothetical protein